MPMTPIYDANPARSIIEALAKVQAGEAFEENDPALYRAVALGFVEMDAATPPMLTSDGGDVLGMVASGLELVAAERGSA